MVKRNKWDWICNIDICYMLRGLWLQERTGEGGRKGTQVGTEQVKKK